MKLTQNWVSLQKIKLETVCQFHRVRQLQKSDMRVSNAVNIEQT